MTNNKSLDCFREISLGEILDRFGKDHVLIEIDRNQDQLYSPFQDLDYENDLGLFWGESCEFSISSNDKVKILDYDTVKIIKSNDQYNLGKILRFFVCKPHSFV
jgi:hypothetical protein